MDEEYEIIMVTFEDFKNDIISKNDKIKSKDEYWWANLKNDLLFYSNTLQGEKRDLVKEAKRKTIAFAKIEVSNYGP